MNRHKMRMLWAGAAAAALLLTGCASETSDGASSSHESTTTGATESPKSESSQTEAPKVTEAPKPREQLEDCNWDGAPVSSASIPAIPSSTEGELNSVLIGSWQHTHIDSGAGYESIDGKDIRFVFPSADRLLYCQHVPGITEYAENAADITWDSNTIVVNGANRLYTMESWNDDTMVWVNERDGSRYLVQRH